MLESEKKALWRFLLFYGTSMLLFIGLLAYGFYHHEKEMLAKTSLNTLQQQKQMLLGTLKYKNSLQPSFSFPSFVTVYDQEHRLLYGSSNTTLPLDQFGWHEINGEGYFISHFPQRFLSNGILVIQDADFPSRTNALGQKVLWFTLLTLLFFMVVGYFLAKLFLQPMRQNIQHLDHFIQDATHEMNTPISSILMSIETCDFQTLEPKLAKKLFRISNAAKTLSHIYEDLVFLNFSDRFTPLKEPCDLRSIVEERIEHFSPIAEAKHIQWQCQLSSVTITSDIRRLKRIIDNLLSNAIKYNRPQGTIFVELTKTYLRIENEGPPIPSTKISRAFERYQRLNSDQGGFGIGLSTIRTLSQELGLSITIEPTDHQTTQATLQWS